MAADNLETSGVRLVAEGADKYAGDLQKAGKAGDALGASIKRLAQDVVGGAGFDKIAKDILSVGTNAGEAVGLLNKVSAAGGSAGGGVAAGMATAVGAIAGVIAIAGTAVLAVIAIGNAIQSAVSYGSSISRLQDSTGLSGGLAQSLSGGAAISGNSASGIAGTFNAIGKAADDLGEKSDKAFGKMASAIDKADTRLARLNEDYARSVDEINASAAERSQEINDRLVESHAAMLQKQQRADEEYARAVAENQAARARIEEDFNREIGEGRAALSRRIGDIEASSAESIARLSERQARSTDDYTRETERSREDLAQSILDIDTNLADKLEALQYRAAEQSTDAVDDGAAAQTKIQEDLQKQLYSIEQKYSAKRQSLQDKIYDPNTNPILRAYYKTQLKSLDGLQKAEEDGARSGASAKEEAARRETERRLAEIQRRLQRETQLEEQEAARRRQREINDSTQRTGDRDREYAQQTADLQAQIQRENAQRDQQTARAREDAALREADLRRSYERQIADAGARDAALKRSYDQNAADAKASYDKQVADAAAAQLKIQAETEKRLAAEKRQYDRALEDIQTALANAGGGGSAAAAGIDKVAKGFDMLGISAEKYKALSMDEQWKLLNDRVLEFVDSGNTDKAIELIMNLTGASREQAAQFVRSSIASREADKILKTLGFTDEQIEQARKTQEGFNTVKLALELLGAQIGAFFLPIVLDLIATIKLAWEWFTTKFLPGLKDTYNFIKDKLEGSFASLSTGAVKLWDKLEPVRKVVGAIANVAMAALDLKVREVEAFWSQYLGPAFEKVGNFLEQHIAPVLRDIGGGILNDFNTKFQVAKSIFEWLYNHLGSVADFFNNIATNIGRISLPSWLQPSGSGFQANVTYPQPPQQPDYSSGFRSQSVPATGAQMAAGRSAIGGNTTTHSSVANVTVNVAKGDSKSVSDGVSSALFKAGFSVVR